MKRAIRFCFLCMVPPSPNVAARVCQITHTQRVPWLDSCVCVIKKCLNIVQTKRLAAFARLVKYIYDICLSIFIVYFLL